MKHLLFSLAFLASASLGAEAPDIQWGQVAAGETVSSLRVPGKVAPREGALSVESARIQGRITGILKREGEMIEAGTPLFAINSAECLSLEEEKRVAEERGLQELIDAARARQQQLGLRVEGGQCALLAASAGTIVKRQVELGATFNIGDALATVVDVNNLTVELDLPERDLALVDRGQPVKIQLASDPSHTYVGRVDRVLPSIDPQTRTSKIKVSGVRLPRRTTLDALILAQIGVRTEERLLRVPTTALVFNHNMQYVIKDEAAPKAVAVEVVNEAENESSIRPRRRQDLSTSDYVAVKGAIFAFNKLKEPDPALQ